MTPKAFEEFLDRMGHRLIRTSSVTWFNPSPRVFTPTPPEVEVDPDTIEWSDLFRAGASVARCASSTSKGVPSYRLIVDDRSYDFASLSSKSRNQTRRGLESCQVRNLELPWLAKHGLRLQFDTLQRQGRQPGRNLENYWQRYCASAERASGAAAWGAFADDQLAAFLVGFQINTIFHIFVVRSSQQALRHYPNNALIFTVLRELMSRPDCTEVSMGYRSIQPDIESLDHFKEGLGFRRKLVNEYIRFSPGLTRILRRPVLRAAVRASALCKNSERMRKLSGMFNWYLRQESK